MIEGAEEVRLQWLCRVAADILAPDRRDLHSLLERIMREVCDQLMALMNSGAKR